MAIKELLKIFDSLSDEKILEVMKALKDCGYNSVSIEILIDYRVNMTRTIDEKIKLIYALKECNYNEGEYIIVFAQSVLETKTVDEQIKIMYALKECEYDVTSATIAIDKSLLSVAMLDELIGLMENAYKRNKDNKLVYDEENESYSDIIEGIDTYVELRKHINGLVKKDGYSEFVPLEEKALQYKKIKST